MNQTDPALYNDEELTELLFVEEDRLERRAVDEILSRADTTAPILSEIVMDKHNWLQELPEWWAPVHATYLLGALGDARGVAPLMAALRWADAFDNDWVTDFLPAIFGAVGPPSLAALEAVVSDPAAGWSARDTALKAMASVSINHPEYARAIFRRIGRVFMDESEDRTVRQFAGQVLLDFRRTEYRMALLKFAREEVAIKQNDAWYPLGFDAEDVEIAFHQAEPELWYYTEDWMRFYEPPEIQRRQKRWARDRLGRVKLNDRPPGGRGEGRVLNFDPDPGRLRPNDPCPCGSGKKYKNCCLPLDRRQPPEPPEGLE